MGMPYLLHVRPPRAVVQLSTQKSHHSSSGSTSIGGTTNGAVAAVPWSTTVRARCGGAAAARRGVLDGRRAARADAAARVRRYGAPRRYYTVLQLYTTSML